MTKQILVLSQVVFISQAVADPDCSGQDRYPATTALLQLQEQGVTNPSKVDRARTEVWRLASEKVGTDLYRQVHHIAFYETSGKTIEVIVVNEVSSEECSMSGARIFRLAPKNEP